MFFKRIGRVLSVVAVSLTSVHVYAAELDFALSKETAALEVYLDTNMINSQNAKAILGGVYTENGDWVGYAGLASDGLAAIDQAYSFGVGVRLYYGSIDTPDVGVGALALGATGRVKFSAGIPLALAGDFHYAPKITTFSDGDEVLDTRIRLETDISPNAVAFIGYRTLTLGLKSRPDYEVDDRIQLGVRFQF